MNNLQAAPKRAVFLYAKGGLNTIKGGAGGGVVVLVITDYSRW